MTSSFSNPADRSRRPAAAGDALIGTTIAGKYRLIRALGQGGMGTVYKAENVPIGKHVALKLLHDELTGDAIAMQRFEREARATVAIAHPNIVEVLDMGQGPRGAPFMVMEYVRGEDLKRLLAGAHTLPVERAAKIAGQILDALSAAHKRGIIHRDLKPENILLTTRQGDRDVVKVVDFGISTFVDAMAEYEREVDLTPTGLTMATPFYASPEQIRGANGRDPRVDVYAVGVMLYEMLSGHRPFMGDTLPELCESILAGAPAPLAAFRRDVPPEFEALVRRALASPVTARFQSAHEFALALVPFGARPPLGDEAEPTDTFTVDLRSAGLVGDLPAHLLRSAPIDLPSEDAPTRPFRVHDRLIRELLGHFEARYGVARVKQVVGGLDPALRRALTDRREGAALGRVLSELDRACGRGDRTELGAAGRTFAKHVLRENAALKRSTPALFFSLSCELWQRYFAMGEAKVSAVGRGYGRLEVRGRGGERAPLALSIAMLGVLDEGLRMSGGRSVSVRIAATSALGDALEAFEATWRG